MEVLDALSYPTVSFNSKSITTTGTNLTVGGDLNFHGRTKPIVFAATTAKAADKLTVDGQANVSLTAFEIDRPSLLMIPVDDTLKISFIVVFPLAAK
jgi:polyisoprenoid-binding protein YceI